MPTNSIAHVYDRLLVRSLHVGTGGVGKWRSVTTDLVRAECIATAPVNDPLDAVHRGGIVGEYKASFDADHRGTRGKQFIGRITNMAPHATYVEHGRSASTKWQKFSWTLTGGVVQWFERTGAREGHHTMRNAGQRIAAQRHAAWHGRDL